MFNYFNIWRKRKPVCIHYDVDVFCCFVAAGEASNPANAVEMYSPPEYPNPIPDESRTYSSYDRSLDDFNDDLYKTYHPAVST